MQTETQTTPAALKLPIAVVSPMDISRLIRELDNLDEFFRQSAIRQGGTPQSVPRYSRLLDELVIANSYNLLNAAQREQLLHAMRALAETAPTLHISFSVDPPGPYVQKIVAWLRQSIDPFILVRVGLQPNIGAGCIVRTPNHSFDFSLRKFFDSKHDFFMKKLHEVVSPEFQDGVFTTEKSSSTAIPVQVAGTTGSTVESTATTSHEGEPA